MGTIDYKTQSIREVTKEMTNGRGADVICDAVGGDVFKECLRRYFYYREESYLICLLSVLRRDLARMLKLPIFMNSSARPKLSKMAKMAENGVKWSKMVVF